MKNIKFYEAPKYNTPEYEKIEDMIYRTEVVMDNGDKIHFDRHVKEDQQLHPYRVNITMNGTPMTGSNYGIFARYTNLNEQELSEKIKDSLDKQRIQFKKRSQEMDR